MTDQPERLDSWKAIADYLGRDVRTLQRWEALGLPVRRLPGGRGHSVFALRREVDTWMLAGGAARHADAASAAAAAIDPLPVPPMPTGGPALRRWIPVSFIALLALAAWRVSLAPAAAETITVDVSELGVVARNLKGADLWRWEFPSTEQAVLPSPHVPGEIIGGDEPSVLVMMAHGLDRQSHQPTDGALRQFSVGGQLRRTFVFTDAWRFGDGRAFSAPWVMSAAQADTAAGPARIAVAAHHHTWWPSVVTLLDAEWNRQASFVNSGWVESLRWLSPARLVISGFNQARDGGMVALLDAAAVDGASPEEEGAYRCRNCGSGAPLQYVVLPRSELNRVTGSAFNRGFVAVSADGIVVRTSEVDRTNNEGALMDAIYEFSSSLELKSAQYGDLYWDRHRALELEGKLTHTRETCPERNGPPSIQVWDLAHGWRTIRTQAPRL